MFHYNRVVSAQYPAACRAAVTALALLAAACAPVAKPAPVSDLTAAQLDSKPQPYRIGVGDELEVKFFATPEMNDLQQVRPDGKISLMFAQDVQAAGKTPDELAAEIRKRLSRHMRDADLVVVMRSFASQKVFVGGEVSKPGPVQLSGHENILQVLDEVGWALPSGRLDQVVLMRRDKDGKEAVYPLNVRKALSGEDMAQNVTVQGGDMIVVPPSDVVDFDRWIDKYLRQAFPFSSSVSYVYTNQTNVLK